MNLKSVTKGRRDEEKTPVMETAIYIIRHRKNSIFILKSLIDHYFENLEALQQCIITFPYMEERMKICV